MEVLINGEYTTITNPLTGWMGGDETPATVTVNLYSETHAEIVHTETIDPLGTSSVSYDVHSGRYTGPGDYQVQFVYDLAGGGTKKDVVNVKVFVPYIAMNEIENSSHVDNLSLNDQKLMALTITNSIDNFTNNWFGFTIGETKSVMGAGSKILQLPYRLWQLDLVEAPTISTTIIDPWNMSVTADNVSLNTNYNYQVFGLREFVTGQVYSVTGNWGWETVPGEIQLAASRMFNIRFCNDAVYRDRWLQNIKTGQWSMEVQRTGYHTTGSAEVDHMLRKHKRIGVMV